MNIAFAGFRHGHIFDLYSKAEKHANICGCFEEDTEERLKIEKEKGIVFNYKSYDELLNDSNVDAVAIGDYYGKRGQMVILALKHGKHVICDKPICTSLKELDEIEAISEENNLKVGCMLDLRYMPQPHKAKELIGSGAIGKVHIASFTGQHPLNYDSRPEWYFEKGKHGGTINDIAIHGIDLVRYITEKNLTEIDYSRTWNAFADKVPEFRDCAQFNVRMEDMVVSGDVSYSAPSYALPTYWDFYFWGSEGMLHFNRQDGNIYIYTKNERLTVECQVPETDCMLDFIDECNGKNTGPNTREVLKSQRQVLLIQRASDNTNSL